MVNEHLKSILKDINVVNAMEMVLCDSVIRLNFSKFKTEFVIYIVTNGRDN